MNYSLIITAITLLFSPLTFAHDDSMSEPMQWGVNLHKFEWVGDSKSGENFNRADASLTLGYDLNKAQLGYKLEQSEGQQRESSLTLSGLHAISAYWDLEYGIAQQHWLPRQSQLPIGEKREQLFVGLSGLAPYFIHLKSRVFLGDESQLQWALDVEKEWLLTQRLAIVPYIETLASAQADRSNNLASGLNRIELGLNLRYQIQREFSPYLGVRRETWFGKNQLPLGLTSEAQLNLSRKDETQWVFGVNWWY